MARIKIRPGAGAFLCDLGANKTEINAYLDGVLNFLAQDQIY